MLRTFQMPLVKNIVKECPFPRLLFVSQVVTGTNGLRKKQHTCNFYNLSRIMRSPTMWYVRSATAQMSLCIRAVCSEPLLVA